MDLYRLIWISLYYVYDFPQRCFAMEEAMATLAVVLCCCAVVLRNVVVRHMGTLYEGLRYRRYR